MIKQTLTFDDHVNGGKITEDWYFNLDVGEVAEMMLVEGDDLEAKLKKIGESQDKKQIFGFFKDMLTRSVGKQVALDSGRVVFRKSRDISDEFFGGGAYSAFFMQLITDEQLAADFINRIMPADLQAQAEKLAAAAVEKGGPEVAAQAAAAGFNIEPTVGPQTPSGASSANAAQPGTDASDFENLVSMSDEEMRRMLEQDDETKEPEDKRPAWLKEGRKPTKTELVGMPREELQLAMRLKSAGKLK